MDFRYSNMESNAVDERVPLITASLSRPGLHAAGLHGVRAEDVARVMLALDIQPHHAIAKGLVAPGLFHGVAWKLLAAPLENNDESNNHNGATSDGGCAAIATAPVEATAAAAPVSVAATPAAPTPKAAAKAVPAPTKAVPAPAKAVPAPAATGAEDMGTVLGLTDAELAAALDAEQRLLGRGITTTPQTKKQKQKQRQKQKQKRRRGGWKRGRSRSGSGDPAQDGGKVEEAFPPLPMADPHTLDTRERLANNIALLHTVGLVVDVPTEQRARELLVQYNHNVDHVMEIMATKGFTQRDAKRSRARRRRKRAHMQQNRVTLTGLE